MGIFTDGDLRRTLNGEREPLAQKIKNFMTKEIKIIPKESLANEALDIMQKNKIYTLAVIDSRKVPIGIIRMHDLIEAGIIWRWSSARVEFL